MRENHTRYAIALLGETMKKRITKLIRDQIYLGIPGNSCFGELDEKLYAAAGWDRYHTQSRQSPINVMRDRLISQVRTVNTAANRKLAPKKKTKKIVSTTTTPAPAPEPSKPVRSFRTFALGGLIEKLSKISSDDSSPLVDEDLFR